MKDSFNFRIYFDNLLHQKLYFVGKTDKSFLFMLEKRTKLSIFALEKRTIV